MKIGLPPFLSKFRLATVAGLIALICILIFLFRLSLVSELEQHLQTAESDVNRMRRNIQNSQNLTTQLEEIERLTDRIEDRVLKPEDAAVNIAYFYQFEGNGVQIESVDQRPALDLSNVGKWKMKNFGTIQFSIRAIGSFREIMDFAYRIRGGEILVRFINLSIVPADGSGEKQRRITLTLEALSALPETETEASE